MSRNAAGMPASLALVGAGKMGGAMLEGWLKLGLDPRGVSVLDPHVTGEMQALCKAHGVALNPIAAIAAPEVVVLAIKPQMLDAAAPGLQALFGPQTLLVSIVAGKTSGDLAARLPPARAIARAMPNTPASVGRGITGVFAAPGVSAAQKAMADVLLKAIGQVVWVGDEGLIDAVTAVSGSGPAYVFYLAECLAKAGVAAGLPSEVAMQLARATVEGAGELMYRAASTPLSQLRVNVTSPGGTTAAALEVLTGPQGLEPLMMAAVAAAKRRAGELSG